MEDDTIHGGFHEESPVGPNDAPTPTADAASRAEDPTLLTSLSAKLDRCMGRIDSLETELGTSKKIMGGAILTLVSRSPATEWDVGNIRMMLDLEGLSRMASEALGHDQAAVPSEDMMNARTEFHTPAFAQFQTPLSADVLSQAAVSESAGPSVVADKGKAPMPDLDIPAEFVAEDAQARQRFEEDQASQRLVQRLQAEDLAQEYMPNVSEERAKELDELMMRMTETDWLNLMMQVGSNPALARELLGADVTEENFVERMNSNKIPPPLSGSAAPTSAGGVFGVPDSTVSTSAAMDSAGSHRESGVSPFADSADSSSPSPVSTDHISIDGWCLVVDKLPDDGDVEDFFSSESESDDDLEHYIPPLPYGAFKDWEIDLLLLRRCMNRYFRLNPDVDVGLDLWRDVNLLCQSLHSDDVEDFWRTQDDWIVSSWKLYPKSSVKQGFNKWEDCVYVYRQGLSYPGNIAGTNPMSVMHLLHFGVSACSSRQMVFSSPWLTAKKESGSPLQTALVCNSNPLIAVKNFLNPLYAVGQFCQNCSCKDRKLLLRCCCSFDSAVIRVHVVSLSCSGFYIFSAACCVLRYIVCWFMLRCLLCSCCFSILFLREDLSRNLELTESKPSLGEDFVPAGSSSSIPADYVSAGHVLVSADRDRNHADC
ncbi:hypothetical protein Tco_0954231 [Tanacetum coccineum]|uniref:Uncharacterized protein n=1 Tax=Tanacetum coccineum TaxID=301880 RepID=A0ABQ5E247_9ASTR